jgi:hypothetical protein
MSHFAKIENGIVTQVIVAEQDFIDTQAGTWIKTSYNTRGNVHYDPITGQPDGGIALRGNYAGVGFVYDAINDVFYPAQPYSSWSLSSNWEWVAPVPMPLDGKGYSWDENTKSWTEIL